MILDVAFGQRSPHVGTEIVDRVPLVALAKNSHHTAIDRHRLALAILKITHFSDRFKFAHIVFLAFSADCSLRQFPLRHTAPASHTL